MIYDLISIIVPVYNTGQYLKHCIESILAQDYPNLEILLINDGSQDINTIQICNQLAHDFENIKVYHKSNGGSASARNYGIKHAKGRYIGFIDSDDVIEHDMFSTLYYDIKENNVKVAIGGINIEENGKKLSSNSKINTGIYNYTLLMHYFMLGNFHSSCTNLYDCSLFEDTLFPENEINEDYMLNFWIFQKIDRISINNKILYHYIKRENSNTNSPISLKFLDWLKHTKFVLDEMKNKPDLYSEAEFQYLFSNIVLANKSLLTLSNQKSNDADIIYKIATDNLKENKEILKHNIYIKGKYKFMALIMVHNPYLYKHLIIMLLRIKKTIK